MSKNLEAFTLTDWMEAEAASGAPGVVAKPEGGVTVAEYALEVKMSDAYCRKRLHYLYERGFATRQRWFNGRSGACWVYVLKPKKEWPKR